MGNIFLIIVYFLNFNFLSTFENNQRYALSLLKMAMNNLETIFLRYDTKF